MFKLNLRETEDDLLGPTIVIKRLTELEDRSRRNNVRIDGIRETSSKAWESCKEEVRNIIANKLGITDDMEIDRSYRMGKFQRNKPKP